MAVQPDPSSTGCDSDGGTSGVASSSLAVAYDAVRKTSEELCAPLETEDYVIQSMPDVSPTRWHLAHTTWFFETFVLAEAVPAYRAFHPDFAYLFNSYYNTVGAQFPRPSRGLLSRPTVKEVFEYRRHVDGHMRRRLGELDPVASPDLAAVIEIGINHEQQHQELMLTDIKHVLSCNPLHPVYRARESAESHPTSAGRWIEFPEGLEQIGHSGDGFSYDNERPRHRVFQETFRLYSRPVTSAEFIDFINDGGYRRPEWWLAEGWTMVQERGFSAPLYWTRRDGDWWNFTLAGMRRVDPAGPVCHVSYYEADAFAAWAEARLPTEAEWEIASGSALLDGNLLEDGLHHPAPRGVGEADEAPSRMFGDVWEWTSSPYTAYPGFRAPAGALGEYNGKFMCGQMVLRGGSCVTPRSHIRRTYRSFFSPAARWQFSGIRLARS